MIRPARIESSGRTTTEYTEQRSGRAVARRGSVHGFVPTASRRCEVDLPLSRDRVRIIVVTPGAPRAIVVRSRDLRLDMAEREIVGIVWHQNGDLVDLTMSRAARSPCRGPAVVTELADSVGLAIVPTPPGTVHWARDPGKRPQRSRRKGPATEGDRADRRAEAVRALSCMIKLSWPGCAALQRRGHGPDREPAVCDGGTPLGLG